MSKLSAFALMMILGAASVAACGGASERDQGDDDGKAGSGGKQPTSSGGAPGAAGGQPNKATGGAAGDTGSGGKGDDSPPKILRGADPALPGTGSCSDVTLGEFIASAHELRPDLSDIDTLTPGESTTDLEREIIPLLSDEGFLLAFKRGDGDCPSGCQNETYWYFSSNESCEPVEAGIYSTLFDGEANCYDVEGERLWGVGRNVAASSRCGYEPFAADVSGTYEIRAEGDTVLCPDGDQGEWDGPFEFVVEQDPADLTKAEVSFKNVHPKVDLGPWPGTVEGETLTVEFERSRSSCIDNVAVDFLYDFAEGKGRFNVDIAGVIDCADPSSDLCKEHIGLTVEE